MQNETSVTDVKLQRNKIDDLESFTIEGEGFRAVVLKQGAQLIHFVTADDNSESGLSDNWLWVSDQAEYKLGSSVRGGVPICWPVFGQFDANPQAVKDSFKDSPFDLTQPDFKQHGYARIQNFELDSFESFNKKTINDSAFCPTTQLVLTLQQAESSTPNLDLKVKFEFSAKGFAVTLITQNNSDSTVIFSQALHTYLPTADITQTTIVGFDSITYSDTLTTDTNTGDWLTKTQQGEIGFNGEVDRIYHSAPDIILNTPEHTYRLQAEGSNSTVVWNPWQDKAKTISQMDAKDYQRMLCIETANAHLDVVELGAGAMHALSLQIQRDCNS